MQQYIYGNIGHMNYSYVSSEPEFFNNAQRAAVLSHLMSYDVACTHGELQVGQHQSFWMVVSNLDNPSAPERLYLQASGCESYRNAIYVRGYLSDSQDGYLYDSQFMNLLRIRFTGLEQTMKVAEENNLTRISPDQLPLEPELQPEAMNREVLQAILLALLRRKKVILRLPTVGAEAMRQSREYLLTIYGRLPYEQRKLNGFVTGTCAARLKSTNTLPAAISLIMMDADADLGGLTSDMSREVIDLAGPEPKFRPMPRENGGVVMGHVKLMDFLVDKSAEEVDGFFRFCRSSMKANVDGGKLGIPDYTMYLEFFDIGKTRFADGDIRRWAGNIFVNARDNGKWTADLRQLLFRTLAQALPVEQLEDYLLRQMTAFDNIKTLGFLTEADIRRAKAANPNDPVRDENAALSLIMTRSLLDYYPEGSQERLTRALVTRYQELAIEKYPFLMERKPTAGTAAQLHELRLPVHTQKTTPLTDAVKERVNMELETCRRQVLQTYQNEYTRQHSAGLERIAAWGAETEAPLPELYEDLKQFYLWAELLVPGEKPNWNQALGDRIISICARWEMVDAGGWNRAIARAEELSSFFRSQGGQLSNEQQERLFRITDGWRFLLELQRPGDALRKMALLDNLHRLGHQLNAYGREAWEALVQMVFSAFCDTAVAAWPCLVEEKPRMTTVKTLEGLRFPCAQQTETQDPCVILRDKIYAQLNDLRSQVIRQYETQYAIQKQEGLKKIRDLTVEDDQLERLYADLQQLYLYEELIHPQEGDWNHAIVERIAAMCFPEQPQTLEAYQTLLKQTDSRCRAYTAHGGIPTQEQKTRINDVRMLWVEILALGSRDCTTLEELLTLFGEVGRYQLAPALSLSLKQEYTRRLLHRGVDRSQIFALQDRLCQPGLLREEHSLLRSVVDSCPGINELGRVSVQETVDCLRMLNNLERAGLLTKPVIFHPWKVMRSPGELLAQIRAMAEYRTGAPEPALPDRQIRRWAVDFLSGNRDLALLMAEKYPDCRESLIPVLAALPDGVSREEIRMLYVAGCSRKLLWKGAGDRTAQSWDSSMKELFPAWREPSSPLDLTLPSGLEWLGVLLVGGTLLVLAASLLPAAMMMVLDVFLLSFCLCVAGVLAVAALLLLIFSFVVKKKAQKLYMRITALAMVPGMVATIVYLVMNLR